MFRDEYAGSVLGGSFLILLIAALIVLAPFLAGVTTVIGGFMIYSSVHKARQAKRDAAEYRKKTYGF